MIKPALLLSGCLFLLFSLSPCEGQLHVKVSAWAGENVVLPCEIHPTEDISVEWSKKGLKPDVVYLYRHGCETHEMKNPAYVFRTHLFMTEMKNGNISLMISNLQPSDTGIYRCRIVSTQQIIKTVHLTVDKSTGYLVGFIVSSLLSLAVGVGVGIFVTKKMTKEAERSHTPIPATSRRSSSGSAAITENNLLLPDSENSLTRIPNIQSTSQMQNEQRNRHPSVVTMAPSSVQYINGNGNASLSPQSPTDRSPHTEMFASDSDAKPRLSPLRNRPSFSKSSQSEGPKHGAPVHDSGPPPRSPSRGSSPPHISSPKRSTPDLSKAAAGSTTSLFNNPLAQKPSPPVRSKSLPVRGPYASLHGKKSPSFRDQNRYSALAELDQE